MAPTTTFPPPPPPTATRWYDVPLRRDTDDDVLGGVVSGISTAYGFDVRTTRVAVALAAIVAFPVIVLAYVVAWIALPTAPEQARSLKQLVDDRRRLPLYVAVGVLVVALAFGSIGTWFVIGTFPWPLALIALGVLLWAAPSLGRPAAGTTTPTPSPSPSPSPSPTPTPSPTRVAGPLSGSGPGPASETSPTLRRPGAPITAIAILLVAVGGVVAWFGDAVGWWETSTLGATIVGGTIVAFAAFLSAIVNRAWWLVVPSVLIAFGVAGLAATQPYLDGGVGRREVAVELGTVASQRLAVGQLEVELEAGAPVPLVEPFVAEVGVGRLVVAVPADVEVVVRAAVGSGSIVIDGDEVASGFRQDVSRRFPARGDGTAVQVVELDLTVGVGRIEVVRSPAG